MNESERHRFWAKVRKTRGCWRWTASKNKYGYGQFRVTLPNGKSTMRGTHRLAWQELIGPIPEGYELDHRCLNVDCVKPAHLKLATHKQNLENRNKARSNSGHRGVSWCKRDLRWQVKITHHQKQIHVGNFKDLDEAVAAAKAKRDELFTHHQG